MSDVLYVGTRTEQGCKVFVRRNGVQTELAWKLDLWNHSPTGFEWGYGGSGPAQLALALLWDVLRSDDLACELHQAFKWEVVAKLGTANWFLRQDAVRQWCVRRDQQLADLNRGVELDNDTLDLEDSAGHKEERSSNAL
jgi:Family of unknown function (DUF6166)